MSSIFFASTPLCIFASIVIAVRLNCYASICPCRRFIFYIIPEMNKIEVALLLPASYFLGGIPTGYLIGRLKSIDIRQHGSGNPGTANVYRTMGALPGIITFAVDFLKGFVPSFIAIHYFYCEGAAWNSLGHWWIPVAAGGLAIAGHIWTPFLSFKGGKGVATSAGVFMALLP